MSRITLDKHANGEEKLVVGWDRPLDTYFWHLYNEDGDTVEAEGQWYDELPNIGVLLRSMPAPLREKANTSKVVHLLRQHRKLDYPDSNVTVDLTRGT